jgi:hypothetical protein
MLINQTDAQQIIRSIEEVKNHKAQSIYKYTGLGKLFKLKNTVNICTYCQEEWPCDRFIGAAENLIENTELLLDAYEELEKSFNKIAAMQAESLTRIAMARDALNTPSYTEKDVLDDNAWS